jgi:ketosteroid isomerase-like protein/predicted enzyme related to lactoylglutathione lyase
MTAVEHRPTPPELLAAFQRALVAESADDLADLHAPDALYEFPLLDRHRRPPYAGRAAIRAGFAAEWSAAPVRVTGVRNVVVHETADPEVVVAEQEAQVISTATGEQLVVPFLLVLRTRDGRIVHTRDYSARAPLTHDAGAALRLELVTVPVSDVDRAKVFYVERVGFGVDLDHRPDEHHRFVRLTPPGSACSIALTVGYVDSEPGSLIGVQLVVHDAHVARAALRDRGVDVSDVEELPWGRFFFFSDPDGNGWSVQEPRR